MAWGRGGDKPPSRDAALLARAACSCSGSALVRLSVTPEWPCCPWVWGREDNDSWYEKAAPWTPLHPRPRRHCCAWAREVRLLGWLRTPSSQTRAVQQQSRDSLVWQELDVPGVRGSVGTGSDPGAGTKPEAAAAGKGKHHTQPSTPPALSSDPLVFGWRAGNPWDNLTGLMEVAKSISLIYLGDYSFLSGRSGAQGRLEEV